MRVVRRAHSRFRWLSAPRIVRNVYLLAGQSNMVGFSGPGSREDAAGEPDAPTSDVLQLNVTGNDASNFVDPDAFTDTGHIAVKSPRFVPATHPLHDGFETGIDGKSGTQIGPALSFARSARAATTAEVMLIPAAWSDTGFCARATNRFDGMGWNADTPASAAFAGTLLHDRAIARVNLALQETDGILRGILWHQGEAEFGRSRVCSGLCRQSGDTRRVACAAVSTPMPEADPRVARMPRCRSSSAPCRAGAIRVAISPRSTPASSRSTPRTAASDQR